MNVQKPVLDLYLFSPECIKHDAALADALAEVEAALNDTDVEAVIIDLMCKTGLLEFILSASPMVADRVSSYVLEHFPTTADAFASSLAHKLLQRFWSYLFFIRRSFPTDTSNSLENCRKSVEWAPSVLQAISTMLYSNTHLDSLVQNGARHRGAPRRRATVTVNPEPFQKLGIDAPNTTEAAEHSAVSVLQDQKRILEVISFMTLPFLP
ncbi:hypothetical protein PILCRDRAFT_818367 [Piloderma croceum F 1598]|uniref:Uncharacterized protein n=1 Tax=Piloderma croceum (strain F 1598) TaxID=765440 RepID=A0A0C3FYM6_PILCF|nr:hypothetical protein PILCRDRAFT_818367 [Piloderma croceum F 1598]